MTATEAYRKTTEALNDDSDYTEDHEEIMAEIEDACEDGEYSCDFMDDEYDKMERHAEDLRKDGFIVEHMTDQPFGRYVVSWKHAGPNA